MNNVFLFLLLTLVSCANFAEKFHKQIAQEEKLENRRANRSADNFAPYRKQANRFRAGEDKRPIKNPVTFSLSDGGPSRQLRPAVKREYRPQRYQADDFKDTESDGSLWANQGSSSSLFTYQNDKRAGDIVIINVLENLRNQISNELKRTFPDKPRKQATKDGKPDPRAQGGNTPPQQPGAAEEMDMKVYDKISGTVMEEISKDYILLQGRKEVIFKKEKRSIEVQALVSRKDIMENDYVNSDRLLESRVFILRDKQ